MYGQAIQFSFGGPHVSVPQVKIVHHRTRYDILERVLHHILQIIDQSLQARSSY